MLGWGVTDWEQITTTLLDSPSDVVWFTAGYTLPLAVGIFGSVSLLLAVQRHRIQLNPIAAMTLVAGIPLVTGLVGAWLGFQLGALPHVQLGWPVLNLVATVTLWYFNSYGWGLTLSAIAIGAMAALHVDYWRTNLGAMGRDVLGI